MMEIRQSLARWIDKNTTQIAFAREIGVSRGHLSLMLRGKRGVSFDKAFRIEAVTRRKIRALDLLAERPSERESA